MQFEVSLIKRVSYFRTYYILSSLSQENVLSRVLFILTQYNHMERSIFAQYKRVCKQRKTRKLVSHLLCVSRVQCSSSTVQTRPSFSIALCFYRLVIASTATMAKLSTKRSYRNISKANNYVEQI